MGTNKNRYMEEKCRALENNLIVKQDGGGIIRLIVKHSRIKGQNDCIHTAFIALVIRTSL